MNAHASILRDFGLAPATGPRRPAPPPEDMELALARARGQARADGYACGVADAEARLDREILSRLDRVAAELERLAADRETADRRMAEICRGVLSTFLEAVSPRLAELNLLPEILAAVEDATAAAPEDRILIEAPPATAAALSGRLDERRCEIRADETLDPAEARVSWRDGFDRIDARPAIERALAILDAHLAGALAAPAAGRDEA